jgi:ribonuclease PH
MALMDAGIPVREHVAGVSVGLVSEADPTTGDISNYRILTDILVSLTLFISVVKLVREPCPIFLSN